MTPEEFLEHAKMTVDGLALFFAGETDEHMETSLTAFGESLRTRWGERFHLLPAEAVSGAVADVLERVRVAKHAIEANAPAHESRKAH